MMICTIHALGNPEYAYYAAICAESAIRNGGLHPEQIYVMMCGKTNKLPPAEVIRKMGCRIIDPPPYHRKLPKLDWLFRTMQPETILYLDADLVVQPGTNLSSLKSNDKCLVHELDISFPAEMDMRKGWCRPPEYFLRFYNIDLQDPSWSTKKWIWGSFQLLNRSIIGTKFWEISSIANEYMMQSDEMSMLLVDSIDQKIEAFKLFPQIYVTGGNLYELTSLNNCILHYAGSAPKRYNAQTLMKLYQTVESRGSRAVLLL